MESEIYKKERKEFEEACFMGWKSVAELRAGCSDIPTCKGIYVVFRPQGDEMPEFLAKGSGGMHKGVDKNYPVADLKENWVSGTSVMYIGKTDDSLRKRIRTYISHGMGKDAAHRGGRSIWQLPDAAELVFAWFPMIETADARGAEKCLIKSFQDEHGGNMPFANRAN